MPDTIAMRPGPAAPLEMCRASSLASPAQVSGCGKVTGTHILARQPDRVNSLLVG